MRGQGKRRRSRRIWARFRIRLVRRPRRGLNVHVRRTLIAGSLLLLPVVLTYVILQFIYDVVNGVVQPGLEWLIEQFGGEVWIFPGIGVVGAVVLIYLAGVLVAQGIGLRVVRSAQQTTLRVPFIGMVYSASRVFIESFSGAKRIGFQRVVIVQYPRLGLWAIGFLTAITTNPSGEQYAVIYIPTAPLPNSGWVAILPFTEVYDTDMTAQAAMQYVFSGGIISPETIKTMKAPEAG